MKQTLLILVALYAITVNAIHAQTTPSSSDNLPPFSTVIPKLELLKSGYPDVREAGKEEVTFSKIGKNIKFIGKKVTTKDIQAKINAYLIDEKKQTDIKNKTYAWKDQTTEGISKLSIYCETLELQDNIWLPETNIDIQAKHIEMHGYRINTSPLPWQKSQRYDLLSATSTSAGEKGGDAGSIHIVCETMNGVSSASFIANGGDGEAVLVPEMSINYPSRKESIEVYKFHGCDIGEKSGQSTRWESKPNFNMVAAEFSNTSVRAVGSDTKCRGTEIYDNGFRFITQIPYLEDILADKRLDYKESCVPGKGGKAGKITLMVQNKLVLESVSAKNGNVGHFIAREKGANNVIYGTPGQPTVSVTFPDKKYGFVSFETVSDKTGKIWIDGVYGTMFQDYRTYALPYEPIDVPSKDAKAKVNDFLKKSGIKGDIVETKPTQQPYVANLEYLQKRINDLESQYSVYFQKNDGEQMALDVEVTKLAVYLDTLKSSATLSTLQKAECNTLAFKASELSGYKFKNIDASNNVAGYRPLLSLASTMEYIKYNLRTDLKLFVVSDLMASSETQAKTFLDQVPKMLEDLKILDNDLNTKLAEQNKVYDALAIKAVICDTQTQSIIKELERVETKLEARAKDKIMWKKVGKIACKTGALICSVIPYGQPMLGQIGGNTLNAIGDNIGDDNTSAVEAVVRKVDLSGAMKDLAKSKFKSPKPSDKNVPPLDLRKKYDNDIEAYKKSLSDTSALFLKHANAGKDILADLTQLSSTPTELARELAKVRATDFEFEQVCQKISKQNQLKAEIYSDLRDAVQKDIAIQAKIFKNRIAILKLTEQVGKTDYSENLEAALYDIRNESLKRLKWVEYQLIKSYEYTTLTPFNQTMPCSAVFDMNYQREKASITPQTIDAFVEKLAMAYDAQRMKMSGYILRDPNLGKYRGDDDFARKVVLIQDDETTTDTKGSELLAELNNKGSVILDLQSDFVNEIIRADESNTRIKDIKLFDVKFDKPLSPRASIKVKLEILDEGILRKDKGLFVFKTGDPNNVSDIWTWELKNKNDSLDIYSDGQSSEYKNLIDFLITGETSATDKKRVSRFTAPPAWSRCRLSIVNNNNVPMPKLTYVELGLKCDRLELSDDNQVVLDIKLQNAPVGVTYTVIKNGAAEKLEDTHTRNDYEIVDVGTSVHIKLSEPESATTQFERWQIYSKSRVNGDENPDKELTGLNLSENTRIVAIFKKKAETETPVAATEKEDTDKPVVSAKNTAEKPNPTAKKEIKLYENPSLQSPIIAIEYDFTNIDQTEDAEEINGFIRVVYNGTQEAYIKKE